MSLLIIYFVKLSFCLAIVYLFYQLVLRRLTFFNSNRWYLAGYTLLSFVIPIINITPVLEKNSFGQHDLVQFIPAVDQYTQEMEETSVSPLITFSNWGSSEWLSFALLAGAGIFLLRFIFRCLSFFRMRRDAQLVSNTGMKLYQVNKSIIPFSFGNSVFINSHLHTEEELGEIIHHEFVHVKQKHTIDIIWSEWLCIINWYNPFAWLLRSAIRQNLEFIADHKVLENGVNRKQYQYLLLKVIGNNHFSIAQKFNFSSLKKRIAMMNKLKTSKVQLLRFLFILPLLTVILISYRQKNLDTIQAPGNNSRVFLVADTIPGELNEKGYRIDVIGRKGNAIVIVKDKNGKVIERISFTKWKEDEEFYEDKYGELPAPPLPPAPPVPPAPPQLVELPDNVKKIEIIDGKKATVVLKDGKVEKYDLARPEEKAVFEKKYGEMPTPPEPPELPEPAERPGRPAPSAAPVKSVGILKTEGDDNLASPTAVVTLVAVPTHGTPKVAIAATAAPVTVEPVVAISAPVKSMIGEEEILVTITKKSTPQQLDEFKRKMKEKGIELRIDETDYNEGILVRISGSIKFKDNEGHFSASDFSKVILSTIKDGEHVYFKVNIVEKGGVI